MKIKKTNKKILLFLLVVVGIIGAISARSIVKQMKQNTNKEVINEFEWKTYELNGKHGKVLLTFQNEKGVKEIHYPIIDGQDEFVIYSNGKTKLSIDYEMDEFSSYEFTVVFNDESSKVYKVDYEVPRIKGTYALHNGIYINEPDITGYVKENTRYLYLNSSGNLVPGNWLTDDEPAEWYDYKEQKWANIYSEVNGIENYLVWIPRYCYKIDDVNSSVGNERMDVKFINTYNEYIAEDGTRSEWKDLELQGYKLPEAFLWNYSEDNLDIIIPGYWLSKYQLDVLSNYKLNYNLTASSSYFRVNSFINNVDSDAVSYTYAINNRIVNTSLALEEYIFENTTPDKTNIINVTALNSEGEIIGSMTKELEIVNVNSPDLSGFDPDTTFYVYWDENGNEHNEIPISMDPPENWYNYTYSNWANIVTRSNGMETYLVWIPRYQYLLDNTSQRSNIKFIEGTGSELYPGYKIPEAFTWINEEGKTVPISGYWLSKYQLSEKTVPKLNAEISISGNAIKVKDITGTALTTQNADGNNINVNIKYEYYLNGVKVNEGTSPIENYVYRNLQNQTTYTLNIIARNADTDEYITSITKKVFTQGENPPELKGFNEDNTYYVIYDENDNAVVGDKIKNNGSNKPDNWYSYIDSKWANIVVTDGNVVDGRIEGASKTTYLVWIPRYQYTLDQQIQKANVKFINGVSEELEPGYKLPEAFKWINAEGKVVQIPGYWLSKYQLSN